MVTTPVFVDAVGPTPGTNLNAADLNVFVQAITYRLSGGIASSASGLTVTQPACQAVISAPGSAPIYLSVASTTVPLSAGPGVSQDQYVYLLNNGTYQVVSVNHGGSPTPPVTANIPLYYATTNGGNTAVTSYTDVSNTNPIGSQGAFMNTTGTNAGGVVFPSTLSVAAATSLLGSATVAGTLGVTGLATLTGGAAMGADIAMANKLLKNAGAVGIGTSSPVGPVHVAVAPSASNNFGVISVGSGAFDGSTAGFFHGTTGLGTLIAGNTAAGFGGNLLDLQNGGVSKALISGAGAMTLAGALTGSSTGSFSGLLSALASLQVNGKILTGGSTPTIALTGSVPSGTVLSIATPGGPYASGTPPLCDWAGFFIINMATTAGVGAGFTNLATVTFASARSAPPIVLIGASLGVPIGNENLGVGGGLFAMGAIQTYATNISTTGFTIQMTNELGTNFPGTCFVTFLIIG